MLEFFDTKNMALQENSMENLNRKYRLKCKPSDPEVRVKLCPELFEDLTQRGKFNGNKPGPEAANIIATALQLDIHWCGSQLLVGDRVIHNFIDDDVTKGITYE